ncbi:glycosyltransferase [Paraburkholderia domus]|uniref:glycosyltransferase n=1 Tax=Paraburkholderia domus TaxID=2793075 RepID=UPI00191233CC|nr:glycosyltransferase [Paraburkholderia domus]MBK5059578.1 glycosyltransferase [Burkholderia sp. R-70199]CAE6844359.1 D-inositol-3-phosphate glycosyltransferase [Paraburkholderia domus]CAE6888509.1 D-inositol-3-phosphate glycosyltransferase [Paraburkholderia domus]
MKILHLLASIDPRAGGPVEGVRRSGAAMQDAGHQIEVATCDAPGDAYLAAFPFPVHAFGPVNSRYSYSAQLAPWLVANANRFDAVIVHGLWQYHGFAAWKALHKSGVPYYVYVHGMLDPWFKQAYPLKHLKKWLYWPWAEYRVLRDARAVIYTTEEERARARQSFWLYRAHEQIVPYGATVPPLEAAPLREAFLQAVPGLRGKRIVLFLGRIHVKKGCDLLIDAFARVASRDPSLHLMIAGPDETGWVASLRTQAQAAGIAHRVSLPGMLQGDLKWGAFHASDVFILPSHQENFGVAVAEALGCGLPALISDKVNVWREIEADGAGMVAADTVDGTEKNLVRWLELDDSTRATMRAQAARTFEARFRVETMVSALTALLETKGGAGETRESTPPTLREATQPSR